MDPVRIKFVKEDITQMPKDGDHPAYCFINDDLRGYVPFVFGFDSNYGITEALIKAKVVKNEQTDPESGCSWFYFDSEKEALAFIERFNQYVDTACKNLKEAISTAFAFEV